MPKGVHERPADIGARISEGKSPGSIARKEKVRELYSQGLTPTAIVQKIGESIGTVKGWIVGVPTHFTGFSRLRHGQAAATVACLTGREGEAIRQEMEAKENDACFSCGSDAFDDGRGWFASVFHHYDDGRVDRAHCVCNAVWRHADYNKA